jgi:antitoxin component YwqK of YwqJK toxin-antitoxin module
MSSELKCAREYWPNGNIMSEAFLNPDGEIHKTDGPAIRRWYENGQLAYESCWMNDKLHNAAGPAIRRWYENGQLAYEEYWVNGEHHNVSGPAHRWWDKNGQLVREKYWLNGMKLMKSEWEAAVKPSPCDGSGD